MTLIALTRAARDALRAKAKGQFLDIDIELSNGDLLVDFQPTTIEAVRVLSLESETFSDTIIRICATQKGYN